MRSVPAQLQTHLDGAVTTTCRLLKVTAGEAVFGLTTLDVDVVYDDGDGEVTYHASRGFDPTTLRTGLGVSVGNAEGMALLSADVDGITAEVIDSGALNNAAWVCYLVNYKDLTAGRHIEIGSGYVGDVLVKNGIVWIPELLDTSVLLKQPIGHVTSRKCRAVHGRPATQENGQLGCGVDISGLWVSGEVQSVGAETDRSFTGDAQATLPATNYPSTIQFLTGDNAGREYAVESVDTMDFELLETTHFPIQAGDTYRHRRNCAKRFLEDCVGINDNGPNFKGEPNIPDGSDIAAPR